MKGGETMNAKFEIDPDLLLSAVEIMRDAQSYYLENAFALSRIGGTEAHEQALEQLEKAKTAETLLYFFGTR